MTLSTERVDGYRSWALQALMLVLLLPRCGWCCHCLHLGYICETNTRSFPRFYIPFASILHIPLDRTDFGLTFLIYHSPNVKRPVPLHFNFLRWTMEGVQYRRGSGDHGHSRSMKIHWKWIRIGSLIWGLHFSLILGGCILHLLGFPWSRKAVCGMNESRTRRRWNLGPAGWNAGSHDDYRRR